MYRVRVSVFVFVYLGVYMLPTTKMTSANPNSTVLKEIDQLIAVSRQKNRVCIIIGLKDGQTKRKHVKNFTEIEQRRIAIKHLQERCIRSLPSGSTNIKRFEHIPYLALEANELTLQALRNSSIIESIQEDRLVAPVLDDSVPLIGGPNAWAVDYSGKGQAVVVTDTGVEVNHPMFQGKVVAEACFSTSSFDVTAETFCPNGLSSQIGTGAGINCTTSIAQCFHGSHVAGIAVGDSNTLSGVAKDADLIAIQVFSRFTDSPQNEFICSDFGLASPCALSFTSDQIRALDWVFTLRNNFNIAAVNMSLGGGRFTSQAQCDVENAGLKAAIDNLRNAGIATIVAAGNEGFTDALGAPACISSAISVGATSNSDGVAGFSNSGAFLSLLAPGVGIESATPGGATINASGTSMATPHVAGAFAVLKSQISDLTVDQTLQALSSTGKTVVDVRNNIAKPRIQLDRAMTAFLQLQPGLNFLGLTFDPAGTNDDTFSLLTTLGGSEEIDRIERYDTDNNTPPGVGFETARYNAVGNIIGTNAPIVSGEGYLIHAKQNTIVQNELSLGQCGPMRLGKGFNIANIGCAQVGMSSYDLLIQIGGPNDVVSLQTFDEKTGRLLTTLYLNNQPAGVDFPVKPTRSVIINTLKNINIVVQ